MRLQLLASLIYLPMLGCLDEIEGDLDEENLSTTDSSLTLGDGTPTLACHDGPANAVIAFDDLGEESAAASSLPTTSYDHPACADRFIVEVTGVSAATKSFDVIGGWGEALPQTQTSCERAHARVKTLEYSRSGWSQVGGDVLLHGVWTPFFDSHYCKMAATSPLPVFRPSTSRSKVRVAVKAYSYVPGYPEASISKRGKAGVYSQPMIY
jgi:hypothetical protein